MAKPAQPGGACPSVADWRSEMHFRSPESPDDVKATLEHDLMALFPAAMEGEQLVFKGTSKQAALSYHWELRFEAALPHTNCYLLRAETSWSHFPAMHKDFFLQSSDGWFKLATRHYPPYPAPPPEPPNERYRQLASEALQAEAVLDRPAAVQDVIIAGMRGGRGFSTSHKEGGTSIRWTGSKYVFADYGESDKVETYDDDEAFLVALRKFYSWDASRHVYPAQAPELDIWKLILRLQQR